MKNDSLHYNEVFSLSWKSLRVYFCKFRAMIIHGKSQIIRQRSFIATAVQELPELGEDISQEEKYRHLFIDIYSK